MNIVVMLYMVGGVLSILLYVMGARSIIAQRGRKEKCK